MPDQLTLGGSAVPHPLPRPRRLTWRQHDLLLILTASDEPMRTRDIRRCYADASAAMRRLEALGLVEQVKRGYWRAA